MLGWSTDLRSTLDVHGANLRLHPAHSLQGGVVVAQLCAAPQEVLPLKDHHAAALVRLRKRCSRKLESGLSAKNAVRADICHWVVSFLFLSCLSHWLCGSFSPFCHSFPFILSHSVTPTVLCLISALLASSGTHSAVDWTKGHEAFSVVGQRTAVGFPVGILSPLQDKLLALEVMMLETNPTVKWIGEVRGSKRGKKRGEKKGLGFNQSKHTTKRWQGTPDVRGTGLGVHQEKGRWDSKPVSSL